uniref:Uncharacterized protein n=1 Tax=Arundo donax TaxID=35708 RepID=A0A0A9E7C2_ARUDO
MLKLVFLQWRRCISRSCHFYSEGQRMKFYLIFQRRLFRIDIAILVCCSSNFMTNSPAPMQKRRFRL